MIAAIDTYHYENRSTTAVVLFRDWTDDTSAVERAVPLERRSGDYVPGQFYKRELPCILAALAEITQPIETIVVDSYVQLGPGQPGLGQILFEQLDSTTAVIGVAKKHFHSASQAIEVYRGTSKRPLFVSAAGVDVSAAAERVRLMHGRFRIPTLLKRVDALSRRDCSI